ncbi:MAG: hypothetical protein Q8P31_10975 [Bacillota bacterium]|nr:hypothetical protein [Bacillota bacterium]
MSQINRAVVVKTSILVAVLVAANVLLGLACARVYRQYEALFSPGPELLKLAIWVLGSVALVIAAAGLLVALVRPFWMIIVAFLLSALALVFLLETSLMVSAALGLGYAVLAIVSEVSI